MGSIARAKLQLIPWDGTSPDHVKRMFDQRVACGWKSEEVKEWPEMSAKGEKALYWIRLAQDSPAREEAITAHLTKYPKEESPLRDTATASLGEPVTPTGEEFVPVGHVALVRRPGEDARLGLPPSGIFWVNNLYISFALQRSGLGRSAMDELERRAAAPPLNGEYMVLDAIPEEFQFSPSTIERQYTSRGLLPPAVSNEKWYKRQGYEQFARDEVAYMWPNPMTGEVVPVPFLYLKKRLR